jgi:hypothetical protein
VLRRERYIGAALGSDGFWDIDESWVGVASIVLRCREGGIASNCFGSAKGYVLSSRKAADVAHIKANSLSGCLNKRILN